MAQPSPPPPAPGSATAIDAVTVNELLMLICAGRQSAPACPELPVSCAVVDEATMALPRADHCVRSCHCAAVWPTVALETQMPPESVKPAAQPQTASEEAVQAERTVCCAPLQDVHVEHALVCEPSDEDVPFE
jgi:hypothetical protein